MQLVIVESPTKAKAIQHYLGSDYKVVASKGHIRNIRKKPFGVDVENRFAVSYETEPKAEKILSDLKKLASQADSVLLATDPDREGEAIAWHLCDVLGIDPDTDCRIEYQEVTKDAVLKALQHPRKVDRNLVDAAMTRSILDYLVGFKVSPLLWKKVAKNLSAGRVQTPVLNLICERERERDTFVPEESWTVHATVNGLMATCKEVPKDEKHAREIEDAVRDAAFTVTDISMSTRTTHPRAPFTTSTLVQAAINHLGMDVGIVMSTAQKLFEGESINGELTGLITYMRTDSVRSSDAAIASLREQIQNYYGKEYL
ncbi:MAG: DNA topoisomerase I, partial [Clostridia bacterium]|nr:DNA topoisomerase I [Clostridia bacterium]